MYHLLKKHQCLAISMMFLIILRCLEFALFNQGLEDVLVLIDPVSFVILYIFLGIRYDIKKISKTTFILISFIVIYLIIDINFSVPHRWITYKAPDIFGGLYGIGYALTIMYDWIYPVVCYLITLIVKIIYNKLHAA